MRDWEQQGDFTWVRNGWRVQWNGMPASYSLYKDGYHQKTFETPMQARQYADEQT